MKKLFYRLSSSRSCGKLFSLLACAALGALFAQQAVAQDFEFGWEPFPPSSWDGGWDASLSCKALDGTTTLTRNLIPGTDNVVQGGTVSCTFTDPNNTTCGSPNCSPSGFQETASCLLNVQFNNLSESCVNNNGHSTLTVTGTCPTDNAVTIGTIDCRGRNPNGMLSGTNPQFCLYAGNVFGGNESDDCQWALGFGVHNDSVEPLKPTQCAQAFPADPDSNPPLLVNEVFKFTQKYTASQCTGEFAGLGVQKERWCHSDTWADQPPFCDLSRLTTVGASSVEGFLTADTEYTPNTINRKCPNNGVITLRVSANCVDPGTNDVDVGAINQSTIEVNGRPIIPGSCNLKKG